MKLSHSKVDCFNKCPYQYKLRYVRKYKTLPEFDPQDPLILGSALHKGIEIDANAGVEEYFNAYPVITDRHIEEAMKLEYWFPRIKEVLPSNGYHELKIEDDDFIGYIDYLVPTFKDGDVQHFDLYDFKYSNNVQNYMDSEQLHLYKYYAEHFNDNVVIDNLYFMFVPKSALRIKYKNKKNKRDETLGEFRKRIVEDLDSKEIQFVRIEYDAQKVIDFLTSSKHLLECDVYDKTPTKLCDWCEFKRYCESEGKDDLDMALPSTERRKIEGNGFKKIWFYGLPFSGKTYLANQFDTPLMLNTDGNFKQVDAPVLRIMDEVTTEGRITKRKYAWEVFQEAVEDLEKGSEFKTIIVDLLEDAYDACRIKVCADNGWDHESDDSFKAYDIIRSEYLRTMKRLLNLDYNIVLISHEDTSRDITRKTGDKITSIKPNLPEKIALKIAGMVDIACRIVNDEGKRTIRFKSNEVEFGGGRLSIKEKEIPCEYAELLKIYGEGTKPAAKVEQPKVETAVSEPTETETPERAPRTRKPREVVEENVEEIDQAYEEAVKKYEQMKQQPIVEDVTPTRRRRRGE